MIYVKLDPRAVALSKANVNDAGWDITAIETSIEGNLLKVRTGIAINIPTGHVGLLCPRSSICKYNLIMVNGPGVIDAGYQGEVVVNFFITDLAGKVYKAGDRVAQLVLVKLPYTAISEQDTVTWQSSRGAGGFGSSGE